MKNQVLSIEQMQKLKELGVDINKASMCYISKYPSCDFDDGDSIVVVSKDFNKRLYNEFGPAFTLQDILELLPKEIMTITEKRYVSITECYQLNWNPINGSLRYDNVWDGDCTVLYGVCYTEEEGILFAAYHLLVWVVENGYLTSK